MPAYASFTKGMFNRETLTLLDDNKIKKINSI